MSKLFDPVKTGYDPKNKPVHLCKTENGKFFVYKPSSGFKSRSFDSEDDEALQAIYNRQCHDGQTFASYLPGERNEPVKKPRAEELIAAIEAAVSLEELEKALAGDTRKTVVDAYTKKKEALAQPND